MPAASSRRDLLRRCGAAGSLLVRPSGARAGLRTLRLGHNSTDGSHYGQGALAFATAVDADPVLSSSISIEVHGNAELGDTLGMLRACAAGTLDFMICSVAVISNVVHEVGVLDAPFLFRDVASARAVLDGPIGAQFTAAMPSRGLHALAWTENGLRHITANKPIRTPADLHGLKLRLVQSDVLLRGFRALGADARTESFSYLRQALRTGRFEAEENAIVVIEAERLYEVQSTLSLTGHAYDAAVFLAAAPVMAGLSPPQRQALLACAGRGAAVTRAVATAAQRSGIRRLAAAGMTVVADVDVAAMRAQALPFLQSLSGEYGAALVRQLLAV